jgi:hypothetical protein
MEKKQSEIMASFQAKIQEMGSKKSGSLDAAKLIDELLASSEQEFSGKSLKIEKEIDHQLMLPHGLISFF